VVGLGPAGAEYLSGDALARIADAPKVVLRTRRHPAAAGLEHVDSFDHLYDSADTFDEVYGEIVEALVVLAERHAPVSVVYAVPGSPLVAERTVELLRADSRVDITIIPALSFLDLAWERLGIDPLNVGIRLVDAERFAEHTHDADGPMLVAQCWSTTVLSDIKLTANDEDAQPGVFLLHHLGLDDEQIVSVDWWDLDRTITPDHLTSLFIPGNRIGASPDEMAELEELVRTLRAECPWDRVQTHATLKPHLVEESYEVLDALDDLSGPDEAAAFVHLEEELGDLLFQIVFHARLAEEEGHFDLADVTRGVRQKLVHRHPHVFGDVDAATADQVVSNWEEIKKAEKGRASITDGIPNSLPALLLATKLQRKGLVLDLSAADAVDAPGLTERVAALVRLAESKDSPADAPVKDGEALNEVAVGDLLFDVAELARRLGVDPEQALRSTALHYRDQIVAREIERANTTPD